MKKYSFLTMAVVALFAWPIEAEGQERQPPADSLRADTTRLLLPQTPEEEKRVQAFPKRLIQGHGRSYPTHECDRDCLLSSPVLTLIELLERIVPGVTTLRVEYFGGPHHLLNGPAGPGFVRVFVDGRELVPLESGQVDFTRISLIQLDHVRVVRRADEIIVDLTSRRQDQPVAFSRITAGTGTPDVQVLRGTFSNGLGRNLTMEGFFDLLDVNDAGRENDFFEFQGRVSWMPNSNRVGIELEYSNQDVLRTSTDSVDFDRRELILRGRANVSEHVQAEVRLGSSQWRQEGEALRDVDEAALALAASSGRASGTAELRFLDGTAYPSVTARVDGSFQPVNAVTLDLGAQVASWDDFSASEIRFGAAVKAPTRFPLTLRMDASTGRRGVSRPLLEMPDSATVDTTAVADSLSLDALPLADSVSFDAVAFRVETKLGAFNLYGRYSFQRLSGQLPFRDEFDLVLAPGPGLEVNGFEAGVSGPVIPLGALVRGLEPLRLEAFWRNQDADTEGALYLPDQLLYGRLLFHGRLFDGNLELWLSGDLSHRSQMLSARQGEEQAVVVPSYTWTGAQLAFRVAGFNFWWKLAAPAGTRPQDVADVPFPSRVNVFGIKWEFVN